MICALDLKHTSNRKQGITLKWESKFWQEVKRNLKDISFTRLESWASAGVPDLLCYNKNNVFFTIELKVIRRNKIGFSPHQIAFHVKHPKNTFILLKAHEPSGIKLYEGSKILSLLRLGPGASAPVADSWRSIQTALDSLSR